MTHLKSIHLYNTLMQMVEKTVTPKDYTYKSEPTTIADAPEDVALVIIASSTDFYLHGAQVSLEPVTAKEGTMFYKLSAKTKELLLQGSGKTAEVDGVGIILYVDRIFEGMSTDSHGYAIPVFQQDLFMSCLDSNSDEVLVIPATDLVVKGKELREPRREVTATKDRVSLFALLNDDISLHDDLGENDILYVLRLRNHKLSISLSVPNSDFSGWTEVGTYEPKKAFIGKTLISIRTLTDEAESALSSSIEYNGKMPVPDKPVPEFRGKQSTGKRPIVQSMFSSIFGKK